MKKTFFTLAAAAVLMSAASCRKDYTCTCTYNNGGDTFTEVRELESTNRASANGGCPETVTQTFGGDSFTGTCDLDD